MDQLHEETINNFNKNYKSNTNAVKKGVALFKNNVVRYLPFDEEIVSYIAKVPDENNVVNHTVKIQIFKQSGVFYGGNCSCRPNRVDDLLCKHIVAATLTIQDDISKTDAQ